MNILAMFLLLLPALSLIFTVVYAFGYVALGDRGMLVASVISALIFIGSVTA